MSEEEDRKIVKFNVGGTRYEVARSLIEMHPDTMLARVVSKEWQLDPSKEVFIERNGSRFKYVLDYLRDGKALVSNDVCKESILAELQYFGISHQERDVQHGHYGPLGSIHSSESILASSTSKIFRFVHICLLHTPRPFFQKSLEFTVYDNFEKEFCGICREIAEIFYSRGDERKLKLLELSKYYGFSPQDIIYYPAKAGAYYPAKDGRRFVGHRCTVKIELL